MFVSKTTSTAVRYGGPYARRAWQPFESGPGPCGRVFCFMGGMGVVASLAAVMLSLPPAASTVIDAASLLCYNVRRRNSFAAHISTHATFRQFLQHA